MADKNIGSLPAAAQVNDDSLLVMEQQGKAHKVTGALIKTYSRQGVEQYVTSAQDAAKSAAASAKTAEDAAESIGTAVEDSAANAREAQAARDAIVNMIVEAVTLATGRPATVTKELVDGVYKLVFGLPAGAKGDKGNPGNSIRSITRTSGTGAAGTVDTYTITLTDGTVGGTFAVYNGMDGIGAGDMTINVYDPQRKATDIYKYADDAAKGKQDKLTGTAGQMVGFDDQGNAQAQDAPFLPLAGGTVTGRLVIQDQGGLMVDIDSGGVSFLGADGEGVYFGSSYNGGAPVAEVYGTYGDELVRLSGIAAPSSDIDAANKGYVDAQRPRQQTITLTAAGWSGGAQTVSVPGILADETAQWVRPVPAVASQDAYLAAGIRCTGFGADSLTFAAETVPTADLQVYIIIQEVGA